MLQHDPAGIEGHALGPKIGETLGDDIGVYELPHRQCADEDAGGGCGFASATNGARRPNAAPSVLKCPIYV